MQMLAKPCSWGEVSQSTHHLTIRYTVETFGVHSVQQAQHCSSWLSCTLYFRLSRPQDRDANFNKKVFLQEGSRVLLYITFLDKATGKSACTLSDAVPACWLGMKQRDVEVFLCLQSIWEQWGGGFNSVSICVTDWENVLIYGVGADGWMEHKFLLFLFFF